MEISVIIPVYNAESTIKRCIDSILAQTFSDFEIIMVDDGSTDGSLSIMRDYEGLDSRIVVISKPNGGVSSARNMGLSRARGRYIQFIDADDDILPLMFETMHKKSIESDADMVTCRFKHDCWKPFLPSGTYYMKDRKDCMRFFSDFFTFNVPWNKLIKRSLITYNFNESFKIFEDGLFVLENLSNINKVVVLDQPFYNYFNATAAPNSAVNAFLKTKFWETRDGYWFKQLLIVDAFKRAFSNLGFERTESFIRTRMFDMAFVELVKLIDSDVDANCCCYEMYAIFSDPSFIDSLTLFKDKQFEITYNATKDFITKCFASHKEIQTKKRSGEPFFEYIDIFFAEFSVQRIEICEVLSTRLLLCLQTMLAGV